MQGNCRIQATTLSSDIRPWAQAIESARGIQVISKVRNCAITMNGDERDSRCEFANLTVKCDNKWSG